MNSCFARIRPEETIDEAITYLRQQVGHAETIDYAYVLAEDQRLLGVVSLRDLMRAEGEKRVAEVMTTRFLKVSDDAASSPERLQGERRHVPDVLAVLADRAV